MVLSAADVDIVATESPAEFFQAEIARALGRHQLRPSVESTVYLVQLLVSFIRPDRLYEQVDVEPDQPLAEIFLAAASSEGMRKFRLLKFSGDLALFHSGIFANGTPRARARRDAVDLDYYIRLGGSAYATVAVASRSPDNAALFGELAVSFAQFVRVLNRVSANCALIADSSFPP